MQFGIRGLASGITDIHKTFTDLFDPHTAAAAGNTDPDIGVGRHDFPGRQFHHRNMGPSPADFQGAGLAFEDLQITGCCGHRQNGQEYHGNNP